MRVSPLILAIVLTSGCSTRADQVFAAPGLLTGSSGPQPGYAIKLVLDMEPPSTIFGDDGSMCRLIAQRYAEVDPGDWLACEWTIAPDTTPSIARAGT